MNRRTKEISQELSLQAERWCYDNLAGPTPAEWNDKFHQKFAELIVQRTLDIVEAHTEIFQSDEARAMVEHIKNSVKTDFGVEDV